MWRAHQPNTATMQPVPIPQLAILPIYIQKIKITTAQAREALPLHLHHRVSSQSARGNCYLGSQLLYPPSCVRIFSFIWASNLATMTLLNRLRNAKSLLRSSAQSRSSSRRTTRQWENATGRWKRFAVGKGQRSAGLSMRPHAAPSKHHAVTTCWNRIIEFVQPGMLRSYQASSLLTRSVKSCLWKSVELDVPLRKDQRSAMTRWDMEP